MHSFIHCRAWTTGLQPKSAVSSCNVHRCHFSPCTSCLKVKSLTSCAVLLVPCATSETTSPDHFKVASVVCTTTFMCQICAPTPPTCKATPEQAVRLKACTADSCLRQTLTVHGPAENEGTQPFDIAIHYQSGHFLLNGSLKYEHTWGCRKGTYRSLSTGLPARARTPALSGSSSLAELGWLYSRGWIAHPSSRPQLRPSCACTLSVL